MNPEDDVLDLGDISRDIDASEDIASSFDEPNLEDSPEVIQGNAILEQFAQLNEANAQSILTRAEGALLRSMEANEEYIKQVAQMLYNEIYKQARLFLKKWCAANNYRQKWRNPFKQEFRAKFLKHNSPFIPQLFSVSVINTISGEERSLIHFAKTSREATINAAKALGFDDSIERKIAFSRFSASTIKIILDDPKYLKEQEILYEFEELRRQIDSRKYVPFDIRERWRKELEELKVQRNGVI